MRTLPADLQDFSRFSREKVSHVSQLRTGAGRHSRRYRGFAIEGYSPLESPPDFEEVLEDSPEDLSEEPPAEPPEESEEEEESPLPEDSEEPDEPAVELAFPLL